jgi:hypothetical protein
MYKIVRLICLLVLAATFFLLPTASASAALVKCRTDPIFLLSNGDVINVTLDISTDAANIRNLHYVLHVPAGVTVRKVTYTALNLRLAETYRVYQDSPAKAYTIATVVTTRTPNKVAVLSTTRLNGVFAKYVLGYSGERLMVTLSREEASGWIYRR